MLREGLNLSFRQVELMMNAQQRTRAIRLETGHMVGENSEVGVLVPYTWSET